MLPLSPTKWSLPQRIEIPTRHTTQHTYENPSVDTEWDSFDCSSLAPTYLSEDDDTSTISNISPYDDDSSIASMFSHDTERIKKIQHIEPDLRKYSGPYSIVTNSFLPLTNYHWMMPGQPNETIFPTATTTTETPTMQPATREATTNPIPVLQIDATGTTDIAVDSDNNQQSDLSFLQDEVLRVTAGTSQKFVPKPTFETVLADSIQGLKRLRITCRRKEKIRNLQKAKKAHQPQSVQPLNNPSDSTDNSTSASTSDDSSLESVASNLQGLETNLRPIGKCHDTPPGSEQLENFLKEVETKTLDMVWRYKNNHDTDPISTNIRQLQETLRNNDDYVVIPTDKTNSFRVMPIKSYISQVHTHLQEHGKQISHSDLQRVKNEATKLLEEVEPFLSIDEYGYIDQSINSYAIPTPKLLVKDHKKAKPNGEFPTRLIVPASNFVSAISKAGYLGLKRMFDKNKIKYKTHTIIQASDMKTDLEEMDITPSNSTIVSIDAQKYYPSVHWKLIVKAIRHYSKHLEIGERIKIEECLKLIKFGMSSTYLVFQDHYYEYDGDQKPEDRGLTIGGYESAWLSDVVGAFIFDMNADNFVDMNYHKIYRDDGLGIFKGIKSYNQVTEWRNKFQERVNELAEGDYLQFTCEIWADPNIQPMETSDTDDKVKITNKPYFPYLDVQLSWYNGETLQFGVHLKENQQLQYLNKGSSHTPACFRAIPQGVCNRLTKLTTVTEHNSKTPLDELYPDHFAALKQANLINKRSMPTMPTLSEAQQLYQPVPKSERAKQQRKRDARRTTYFCIGYHSAWTTPLGQIVKEAKKKHPELKWLRLSMSYKRESNFREILNGDLSRKLNANITSKDFETLPCNCKDRNKTGCNYGGHCRESIVVYRAEDKFNGKSYIGCTQQHLKNRMQQHNQEVRRLHNGKPSADSFADHFARLTSNFHKPSPTLIRNTYTLHVIWKGNPLSTVKTFGTNNCILCNQERLNIFKWMRTKPDKLINRCSELFGACRHKPRFHRLAPALSSTDESSMDEKVKIYTEV